MFAIFQPNGINLTKYLFTFFFNIDDRPIQKNIELFNIRTKCQCNEKMASTVYLNLGKLLFYDCMFAWLFYSGIASLCLGRKLYNVYCLVFMYTVWCKIIWQCYQGVVTSQSKQIWNKVFYSIYGDIFLFYWNEVSLYILSFTDTENPHYRDHISVEAFSVFLYCIMRPVHYQKTFFSSKGGLLLFQISQGTQ